MTHILGISAFYHDSAAALLSDGQIVAAAQEERFTREKHDSAFPTQAVAYCLRAAGIEPEQLDHVVFYEKPLLKFERLLDTYLGVAPAGFGSFLKAMPQWLNTKLHLQREMNRGLGGRYKKRFLYVEHHEAHAASAFFPSPFETAAILTLDGVGEWTTTSLGVGRGNRIELTSEIRFPHSIGLLYSAFTYYCGFRVNSGEYKLMGLAPYGSPKYADLIRRHLVDVKPDGSFRLDLSCFNYCQGLTMTGPKFDRLFGGPPRQPEAPLEERHLDLAASIQQVTEQIIFAIARHLHARTGLNELCLAGGVALNCVANGKLAQETPFQNIWIQPAAGDAGGALGATSFAWHQLLDRPRQPQRPDAQSGSFLGPSYTSAEVETALSASHAVFVRQPDRAALSREVAGLLADGKVVGWVQGRMEFGPRALGARSILGDARRPEMQRVMNQKIKFRESFRPFAPVVLQERAADYFTVPDSFESPYMLFVAPVHPRRRRTTDGSHSGLQRLNELRSEIPAVTHVDHSARVQTVDAARNPRLHELLQAFDALTGCPLLVNTSFNVRGEPMVCSPADAYRCFLATEIDVLVIEDFLLHKADQPAAAVAAARARRATLPLD